MWNLSGDDIQRAKEELTGRRAAIQARYDNEMKQLDAKIHELEAFARAAETFVLNFKGGEEPAADSATAPAENRAPDAAGGAGDEASAEAGGEPGPEPNPLGEATRTPAEKASSRWRMRLGSPESPA